MEPIKNDPVIAEVQAVRDEYAAGLGYDVAAIFKNIRALQEASDRTYVRYAERLTEAVTPILTPLSEASRQLGCLLGPFLQRLKKWSDANAPHLQAFCERNRMVDALNEVGWLPYHSAPFHYVEECEDNLALLDKRFSDYYRSQWSDIRDDMMSRLEDYHIDNEAKETFREALAAHEAGYYRCVCRVLFPEIKKVLGVERIREKELEKLTSTGNLADFAFREPLGLVLFARFVNHAYEQVQTDRKRFARDPIPNRHAAMHGLVSYSTHKHSMNMLILTDYIFQILPLMSGHET